MKTLIFWVSGGGGGDRGASIHGFFLGGGLGYKTIENRRITALSEADAAL